MAGRRGVREGAAAEGPGWPGRRIGVPGVPRRQSAAGGASVAPAARGWGGPVPKLGPPPLPYRVEGSSARLCRLKLSPLGAAGLLGRGGALSRPLLAPLKPCSLLVCPRRLRCAGTSIPHPAGIAQGACSGAFSF